MGLTGKAKREYQREYMRKKRSNTGLTESGGSNNKGLTGANADVTHEEIKQWKVVDTFEEVLAAANAILDSKGIPKVHKGVEPDLPFGKKVQASRKRM